MYCKISFSCSIFYGPKVKACFKTVLVVLKYGCHREEGTQKKKSSLFGSGIPLINQRKGKSHTVKLWKSPEKQIPSNFMLKRLKYISCELGSNLNKFPIGKGVRWFQRCYFNFAWKMLTKMRSNKACDLFLSLF